MLARTTYALVGAIVLTACVTPVEHATPSKRPEVTIPGAKASEVKAELVNRMVDFGYSPTKTSGLALVFERQSESIAAALIYGSDYDRTPNARISYTIIELRGSVRVVADIKMVTNPGSAFERVTDINRSRDSLGVQALLQQLQEDLAVLTPVDVTSVTH